jgi:hypothetical protein
MFTAKRRSYAGVTPGQAKAGAKPASTASDKPIVGGFRQKKMSSVSFFTGFARRVHNFSTISAKIGLDLPPQPTDTMSRLNVVPRSVRVLIVLACLVLPQLVSAATTPALFRLFLLDGSVLVSYGEFVRIDDSVLFSMPIGGPHDSPRLQVATIRAELIDWPRTDRYAASVRYQQYAQTRGEEDYQLLSNEVADALNAIASSPDRQQALMMAERVRQRVAEWPQSHFGYRHNDIREIVSVLDQAISSLRAAPGNRFELSFVAMAGPPDLEPVLGLPNAREQLDQVFRLAKETKGPSDRVALLQAALMMIHESSIPAAEQAALRRTTERLIRAELDDDRNYAELSRRMMTQATLAARRADPVAVERLAARIPKEDAKLGRKRPLLVSALQSSMQARLADARHLRLLTDQWQLRRVTYRQYQSSVGSELLQLVKSTPSLEAIRNLNGPATDQLIALQYRFTGGAERLERMRTPEYLRAIHEQLIGAWRFAENAAKERFRAVSDADADAAWKASSSAAGALLMLTRVQQDIKALLTPPKLP